MDRREFAAREGRKAIYEDRQECGRSTSLSTAEVTSLSMAPAETGAQIGASIGPRTRWPQSIHAIGLFGTSLRFQVCAATVPNHSRKRPVWRGHRVRTGCIALRIGDAVFGMQPLAGGMVRMPSTLQLTKRP
jgi:hypothetical protein